MFRSSLDREISESLVLYVKKLNDESRNGALVVVEGLRDSRALRAIGFEGDVLMFCHNGGKHLLVDESAKYRRTILLFDLDREGRSLTKKAALLLEEEKKSVVDLFFRRELAAVTQGRVKRVEELSRYTDYLQPYSKMMLD
jgi:5S rRNA maturation endonuclease (ribonuclease M5)